MSAIPLSKCKRCKRLADFLQEVKSKHPDYFCQPVPAFDEVFVQASALLSRL